MLTERSELAFATRIVERLAARDVAAEGFFGREAQRLAECAGALAERFAHGGRLFTFGRGAYATDAAHVSVEFVHPVIVGKRALPASDMSRTRCGWAEVVAGPDDGVFGFGPPHGDDEVLEVLAAARTRAALTIGFPAREGEAEHPFPSPSSDEHVHQELFEVAGHALYESVQVFLEHRPLGLDVGASAFLYPYLGSEEQVEPSLLDDVAASIAAKARDAAALRARLAEQAGRIASAARAIAQRVDAGGRILTFGNGGSATDADDFAIDALEAGRDGRPIPAISLAAEPAILSAIANDVGVEAVFVRQIIAQARPVDVAFALSTSGGSKNVLAALREARKHGLLTVALLGYDGGEIVRAGLADHALVVQCDFVPRIQEAQAVLSHLLREGIAYFRDGA